MAGVGAMGVVVRSRLWHAGRVDGPVRRLSGGRLRGGEQGRIGRGFEPQELRELSGGISAVVASGCQEAQSIRVLPAARCPTRAPVMASQALIPAVTRCPRLRPSYGRGDYLTRLPARLSICRDKRGRQRARLGGGWCGEELPLSTEEVIEVSARKDDGVAADGVPEFAPQFGFRSGFPAEVVDPVVEHLDRITRHRTGPIGE
jgi:hypothetical protein